MPRPAYLVDTDWIIDHLCGIETVTKKLRELEPEAEGLGSGLAITRHRSAARFLSLPSP